MHSAYIYFRRPEDRATLAPPSIGLVMTTSWKVPLLFALAILLGQLTGFAHALSHLEASSAPKDGLAHVSTCIKCSAFEQLSSGLPGSGIANLQYRAAPPLLPVQSPIASALFVAPFQSRAPPVLL